MQAHLRNHYSLPSLKSMREKTTFSSFADVPC